jgi:hypothetical protein
MLFLLLINFIKYVEMVWYIYVYVQVHTHTHTHTHIHTHTHTHTHTTLSHTLLCGWQRRVCGKRNIYVYMYIYIYRGVSRSCLLYPKGFSLGKDWEPQAWKTSFPHFLWEMRAYEYGAFSAFLYLTAFSTFLYFNIHLLLTIVPLKHIRLVINSAWFCELVLCCCVQRLNSVHTQV